MLKDKLVSPLDSRYSNKIDEINYLFSESYLNKTRLLVELNWLLYLCKKLPNNFKKLSIVNQKLINRIIDNFNQNDAKQIKKIEKKTNHDVKAVEYFIRSKFAAIKSLSPYSKYIHFGLTSEDVNSTSYALIFNEAKTIYIKNLQHLQKQLYTRAKQWKNKPILARTHGQPASPSTFGKELKVFSHRLQNEIRIFKSIEIYGKFSGTTGNFHTLSLISTTKNWSAFINSFGRTIGLQINPITTQIESHDSIASFAHSMVRINNILIDFNRDIWTYISNDLFKLKINKNEVGSSTMPHKVNPIDFENSEGNLQLANSLLVFLADKLQKSRLQRDLSDSTVLRNVGTAISYSFLGIKSSAKGLSKLHINNQKALEELNNNWQVLSEAIQIVMKLEGIDDAYEYIKDFTRGSEMDKESYKQLVNNLPITLKSKNKLLALTPQNYIGQANLL